MSIPPGERRELRSVVRQQFKVLRTEVKQREVELTAEAERRLMERYRDEDKSVGDLNWRIQQIAEDAQRQIDDLMRAHEDKIEGGKWSRYSGRISAQGVARKSEDRAQLRRALEAGLKEQVTQALLALDRQEADLLKALAVGALETEAAREFVTHIPTVADLVPAARLREIESVFDERAGES